MKHGVTSYELRIGWLMLLMCLSACAAAKVDSRWRANDIVADGYDGEWRGSPQFYDRDRKLSVRVFNDAQALFLCISANDDILKRRLAMGGMTLWIDPEGGESRVFGIHLPGGQPGGPLKSPRPGGDGAGPARGDHSRPPDDSLCSLSLEPVHVLAVTYGDATGPLEMTLGEVRRTGIRIARKQLRDGRLVYEFIIDWKAAPSLCALKPGMLLGIGLLDESSRREGVRDAPPGERMRQGAPSGGMGGPGPGGSPGDPGPGANRNHLEIWLQVRLAKRVST